MPKIAKGPSVYLSPVAYLVGIEGAALLRGFREGFADRAFVEARLAEVAKLLATPELAEGVIASVSGFGVGEVYAAWAASYDEANTLIDIEQPIVQEILGRLPVGTSLDAACGTGRHAIYLDQLGHRVAGFDSSPEMLAIARRKLPNATLREGDLARIPFEEDSVDLIVCGLALSYVQELELVMAEFARVLRPGGHLVISDAHVVLSYLRPTLARPPGPDGTATLLPEYHRPLSAYLSAALPLGFELRSCKEPHRPRGLAEATSPRPDPLPTRVSWELLTWCPEAAAAVLEDSPVLVVLHLQLRR